MKHWLLSSVWLSLACVICAAQLQAHEINPAFLQITELEKDRFDIVWKQPLKDGKRLRLRPVFPENCPPSGSSIELLGGASIERWQVSCSMRSGEIHIQGLEQTLTDVFVELNYLDYSFSSVIRAVSPVLDLGSDKTTFALSAYFRIGVEHILFGYDHLLFVLGLCLLVTRRKIVLAVTAFTFAHTLTLALSSLGGISLPGAPVEAVIALSIVLLGREALVVRSNHETITQRYPWIIAFGFGLIHGFGFAGALAVVGLPFEQEIWALLLFNLGVEVGQLLFVVCVFTVLYFSQNFMKRSRTILRKLLAYGTGTMGTYWFATRLFALL